MRRVSDAGLASLEIMKKGNVTDPPSQTLTGWAHIAFSVGSREKVDELTARLKADGFAVEGRAGEVRGAAGCWLSGLLLRGLRG